MWYPLSPPSPDNAMDGGAQQSSLREPPGPSNAEQEGVPGEWDGGEGPPEVKRSQPLFIHSSRWVGGAGHRGSPTEVGGVYRRIEGRHRRGDGGTGPGAGGVRGAQPLSARSRQPPEEEPRASSLPSIPNPFPELCSPSNSPILSSPALGQGPPREGVSHVSQGAGDWGGARTLGTPDPFPPGALTPAPARAGRW